MLCPGPVRCTSANLAVRAAGKFQSRQTENGIRFSCEYGGPAISTVVASPILCGPMKRTEARTTLLPSSEQQRCGIGSSTHHSLQMRWLLDYAAQQASASRHGSATPTT